MNELLDDKGVIRKLRKEIEALKKQLEGAETQGAEASGLSGEQYREIQREVDRLTEEVKNRDALLQQREEAERGMKEELTQAQVHEKELQSRLTDALRRIEEKQTETTAMREECSVKDRHIEELNATLLPVQCEW